MGQAPGTKIGSEIARILRRAVNIGKGEAEVTLRKAYSAQLTNPLLRARYLNKAGLLEGRLNALTSDFRTLNTDFAKVLTEEAQRLKLDANTARDFTQHWLEFKDQMVSVWGQRGKLSLLQELNLGKEFNTLIGVALGDLRAVRGTMLSGMNSSLVFLDNAFARVAPLAELIGHVAAVREQNLLRSVRISELSRLTDEVFGFAERLASQAAILADRSLVAKGGVLKFLTLTEAFQAAQQEIARVLPRELRGLAGQIAAARGRAQVEIETLQTQLASRAARGRGR